MSLYVQFSDEKEEKIITWFGGPQSSDHFDFLGEIELSDSRWVEFYDSSPDYMKKSLPKPKLS